jgi:hypothetical protein
MPDLFSDFLANPSATTFLPLREAVIAAPEYDFYSDTLQELEDLVGAGNHAAATGMLPELMPNWLLSPRVHQLVGQAAAQLGDKDMAQREVYLAKACLQGLMQSGDGSEGRPYRVTHIDDEYEILNHLGKEVAEQGQVSTATGLLDHFVCTDDSELWFDVSSSAQS